MTLSKVFRARRELAIALEFRRRRDCSGVGNFFDDGLFRNRSHPLTRSTFFGDADRHHGLRHRSHNVVGWPIESEGASLPSTSRPATMKIVTVIAPDAMNHSPPKRVQQKTTQAEFRDRSVQSACRAQCAVQFDQGCKRLNGLNFCTECDSAIRR